MDAINNLDELCDHDRGVNRFSLYGDPEDNEKSGSIDSSD